MIAATVGKRFLNAYNLRNGTNYSAKEFFIDKYFSLFFNHEKYLQWVTNSPFVQGIKKGVAPTVSERNEKLAVLIDKISTNSADASIAIGFPSLDLTATTSGQITNMLIPLNEDDVYFSWLGGGLGVGVQGGLSILFDNDQILLDLFDGWVIYRDYLNKMPKLRGNQINTWNGQWLAHLYDEYSFIPDEPSANFDPFETKEGVIEISTQSWVKILIGIAKKYSNPQMMGYIYNLGQTNTTIGFIPFSLPKIRKPIELYKRIFGQNEYLLKHRQIEHLFGTAFGFTKACQLGAIGIEALEPKGIRDMITNAKSPSYKTIDEEKQLTYNTYIIWILAMLNNEQLWESARKIAEVFNHYTSGALKARTDRANNIKAILASTNKKQFIENLIPVVEDSENKTGFEQIAKDINLMPIDNVPYFLTLIRFQYALISK